MIELQRKNDIAEVYMANKKVISKNYLAAAVIFAAAALIWLASVIVNIAEWEGFTLSIVLEPLCVILFSLSAVSYYRKYLRLKKEENNELQ